MTNKPTPTPAQMQEARADALLRVIHCYCDQCAPDDPCPVCQSAELIRDLIAERDAERRRVSEIVKECLPRHPGVYLSVREWETLASLILPDPEPTPEEVLELTLSSIGIYAEGASWRKAVREMAAQGYEIAKIKGDDDE